MTMPGKYTDEDVGRIAAEVSGVQLDPRWEWTLIQRFGMDDMWIKVRCLHTKVIPVENLTGDVVAQLCLTCDTQFPPPQDAP